MIDMHSHIVFDVDDGSDSLEESLAIIKRASKKGIHTMFATSHYIEGSMTAKANAVKDKLEILRSKLKEEHIDVQLLCGHEVFLDHESIDHVKSGKALSLNDSRYILVELPMLNELNNLEDILFDMTIKGYVPIIAHPERYTYVQRDINRIRKWIDSGALLQLNLPSFHNKYGDVARKTAEEMLKRQMYHFVGSDVHAYKSRALSIDDPLNKVKSLVSNSVYMDMIENNPKKVIQNDSIEPFDILELKPSFFKKMKKLIG